jgi:mRNA-degrading endonuclease toxin of MazEF toxin-antitoxin module
MVPLRGAAPASYHVAGLVSSPREPNAIPTSPLLKIPTPGRCEVLTVSAGLKAQQRAFTVLLKAGEEGLPRPSAVLVFQIRTLDRSRFSKRLGSLSPSRMAEVDQASLSASGWSVSSSENV